MSVARACDRAVAGSGMTSSRTRERLAQRLLAAGLQDDAVIEVLRQLPRHLFIEEALASRAYEDSSLPIGWGQTISQPYMVARMTQALFEAGPVQTVLEIGTGSGYQTAVLAALARRVYSVERISALQARAEQRLRALKQRNVRLRHDDGSAGWAEYAPFDGILVTAAASGIPRQLAEQLAPGGRMVLPINHGGGQVLVRLIKNPAGRRPNYQHELLEPVTFVPLLGGIA
ncbi:protein-L-isoaspartate(D-aspartate) O-methyltransferase [Halochromatium salexigens]|uniref:Protein-L-isoaspartate O-methyltransferase n=1 Tax=Halochromatium salexigens TaxID=49447 RepID=A0AAJ0UI02_HALSE|nr:protein-L-isoaspartate(D-aspartate) O-methyltransferase [Halochromatium salexigens]MBK5931824.1 protein-L-isoaspartate O-methyltransferase [Halochromatium salexigens]